jgi:cysteinyl-tRNA synthetase
MEIKNKKLNLYNHLTKKNIVIDTFDKMTMYVCGPTLYDELHIGNGRSLVIFDVIFRIFKVLFKEVIYVRNITDIEDKIIIKCNEEKKNPKEIVDKYEEIFNENLKNLNILPPTFQPKATDFINEMIEYIKVLIKKDFAYVTPEGNVYFRISQLEKYDFFQNPDSLKENLRIENENDKENWQDFVLWKKTHDKYGYESPWCYGRPGWHLECSVMSNHYLGDEFLVHGGGEDLAFPHHHNEIAQGLGYSNKCCSKIFLHNGLIQFNGEKMSKSLGNVIKISSMASNKHDGDILRYLYISTYYNSSLNVTDEVILQSKNTINKIREFKFKNEKYKNTNNQELYLDKILTDINIPKTFTYLFALMNDIDKISENYNIIINTFHFLGFDLEKRTNLDENQILELIKNRQEAKNNKDYNLSDKIRKELEANFVKIEDKKDEQYWFYI